MLIHELRIQAFGRFKEEVFCFNDGLSLIFGRNESGKTTILQYIFAFLYGFGRAGRDPARNARTRYLPWQGEAMMGGSLHFERDGRRYILERRFGSSKTQDQCRLLDARTAEQLPLRNPVAPGEEILGMSENEFLNSSFLAALETRFSSDDAIERRVNRLLSSGDETFSYDELFARLRAESRKLTRGGEGGVLESVGREEELLVQTLFQARERDRRIQWLQEELRKTEAELEQLKERMSASSEEDKRQKYKDVLRRWELYSKEKERMTASSDELRDADAPIKAVPVRELTEMNRLWLQWQTAEQRRQEATRERFIADERLEAKKREAAVCEKKFQEKLSGLRRSPRETPRAGEAQREAARWKMLLFVLLAAELLIIAGVFLFRHESRTLLLTLIVFAALLPVAAAAAFFMRERAMSREQRNELERIREEEIRSLRYENEKGRLDWERRRVCNQLDFLNERRRESETVCREKERQSSQFARQLMLAMRPYYRLPIEKEQLTEIFDRLRERSLKGETARISEESGRQHLEILLGGLSEESFRELAERCLAETRNAAAGGDEGREIFSPQRMEESLRKQKEEELRLYEQRASLVAEIKAVARQGAGTAEAEKALQELRAKKRQLALQLKSIEFARQIAEESRKIFIREARPSLNLAAAQYLTELSGGRYREIRISPDWRVSLEWEDGQLYDDGYFSAGTRDIIWLSLRLALRDLIAADGALPPLLLDDSLRQLDAERQETALALLKRFSDKRRQQILCFSSSEELKKMAVRMEIPVLELPV